MKKLTHIPDVRTEYSKKYNPHKKFSKSEKLYMNWDYLSNYLDKRQKKYVLSFKSNTNKNLADVHASMNIAINGFLRLKRWSQTTTTPQKSYISAVGLLKEKMFSIGLGDEHITPLY